MYVCVWPSDDRKKALVQQQERSRQEALSVLKVGTTVHDNNRIHTYIHTYTQELQQEEEDYDSDRDDNNQSRAQVAEEVR